MRPSREDKFWMGLALAVMCFAFGLEAHWDKVDAERAAARSAPPVVFVEPMPMLQAEELVYIAQYFEMPAAEVQTVEPEGEDPDEPLKIEAALVEQGYFRADVPLCYDLQDVLRTACEEYGVPYAVALGLIETESRFNENAVNTTSGCYGLCQLNPKFFPAGLSSVENIRTGMAYLGEQIERYDGDLWAALTAYNAGYDTGRREYATLVMTAAERWREP
ncbi:MAG: lytic transglycosylase domain-containing protein [Roseburia sp.]|nr:lytic transglycosylase domain-containing protein [Roseburia sp.]